jgi:hypothetical protein
MRIQHASPLAHKRVSELWLGYTPAGTGSGFWIHFGIMFFAHLGMRIQHASPLALKRLSEVWLGYTPVGTGSGFWIHFEIVFLHSSG